MKKEWNKKIWIAKKIGTQENDYGTEIPIYDKPQAYMMNVQPITSEADIAEFGENAKQMQKAVIEYKKYFGEFKEFDVAYLDGVVPSESEANKSKALKVKEIDSKKVKDVNNLPIMEIIKDEYFCNDANYRLYPPRNQNKVILLYFTRITAK